MAKIVCPSCGFKNPAHQYYCVNCGTAFSDDHMQSDSSGAASSSSTISSSDIVEMQTMPEGRPIFHHRSVTGRNIAAIVVSLVLIGGISISSFDGIIPLVPSVVFSFFLIILLFGGLAGYVKGKNLGELLFYDDKMVNIVKGLQKDYGYADITSVSPWTKSVANPNGGTITYSMVKITWPNKTVNITDPMLPRKATGEDKRMRLSDFLKSKNMPASQSPPDAQNTQTT